MVSLLLKNLKLPISSQYNTINAKFYGYRVLKKNKIEITTLYCHHQ